MSRKKKEGPMSREVAIVNLYAAIRAAHVPSVEHYLKEFPGIANCCDKDAGDEWPLHLACGNVEIARLLLADGARTDVRDGEGYFPIDLAIISGAKDVVELLLDHGHDVNGVNGEDNTPLDTAARWGQVEIAAMLLDRGADIRKCLRLMNCSVAHTAARNGHVEVLELFFEHGVSVDDRTIWTMETPLHLAARVYGQSRACSFLLERGADVNALSREGWSPLFLAAQNAQVESVAVLLAAGATAGLQDGKGVTPLDLAEQEMATLQKRLAQYRKVKRMLRHAMEMPDIS